MVASRAWIITLLIVLLAAGAYVLWIVRPRTQQASRSLSAARPTPKVETRTLHIEGCNDDFVVKKGELVEPRVVPGSMIEQFRGVYGKETSHDKSSPAIWDLNAFLLTENAEDTNDPSAFVHLSLKQGHVVQTLDNVELGIDTFGVIFHKMRDRNEEVHETIEKSNGNWIFRLSLFSTCGRKFRSEYSRSIPSDPQVDREIAPAAPSPNSSATATGLPRSDVFMNKLVSEYTLTPSNGSSRPLAGQPSEHE